MALHVEQKREISQLMFTAWHYLGRASKAKTKYARIRMGETKKEFRLNGHLSGETRRRTVLGANLASAATRLATVDDVLYEAKCVRPVYRECRIYFGRCTTPATRIDVRSRLEWFHILFRDAVGHAEPEQSPTSEQKMRFRSRQDCIEEATFGGAYSQLHKIAEELEAMLRVAYRIRPRR
jgi:hypothetical protein